MKRIIETTEKSGFEELLGEKVLIFSMNYIYTGKLTGINDTCVLLDEAQIVYETGVMTEPGFKDAQPLPHPQWYISLSTVESFGRAL